MTHPALSAAPEPQSPETGIDGKTRIANGLTGALADSYVLMIKTQGVHWNVVGPLFQPIHEMTEAQYADLFAAIDTLAERIRALGHLAPVAFTDMISQAELSEETAAGKAADMVRTLVAGHEVLARRMRDLAELAADHRDGATEDLANSRMDFHEKAVWMLSAVIAE